MKKNNVIPRKFNKIKGEILINTSLTGIGDIIYITKDEKGYLGYNINTNKYARVFVEMLRNSKIFKIIEVV